MTRPLQSGDNVNNANNKNAKQLQENPLQLLQLRSQKNDTTINKVLFSRYLNLENKGYYKQKCLIINLVSKKRFIKSKF